MDGGFAEGVFAWGHASQILTTAPQRPHQSRTTKQSMKIGMSTHPHLKTNKVYSQRSEASLVVPIYLMKTVNVPPKKQCWYILSFELQSKNNSLIFQFLLFGIFLFVGIRLFVQPLDRAYNHLFSFHRVFFRLSLDKHFPQPRHRQTQACWSCLCNQPASGEFMATGFKQF